MSYLKYFPKLRHDHYKLLLALYVSSAPVRPDIDTVFYWLEPQHHLVPVLPYLQNSTKLKLRTVYLD